MMPKRNLQRLQPTMSSNPASSCMTANNSLTSPAQIQLQMNQVAKTNPALVLHCPHQWLQLQPLLKPVLDPLATLTTCSAASYKLCNQSNKISTAQWPTLTGITINSHTTLCPSNSRSSKNSKPTIKLCRSLP